LLGNGWEKRSQVICPCRQQRQRQAFAEHGVKQWKRFSQAFQGVVAGQVPILANSDGFDGLQALQDRLSLAFFVIGIGVLPVALAGPPSYRAVPALTSPAAGG
jgi:hypothetical protein